jgi:hypothetical protein
MLDRAAKSGRLLGNVTLFDQPNTPDFHKEPSPDGRGERLLEETKQPYAHSSHNACLISLPGRLNLPTLTARLAINPCDIAHAAGDLTSILSHSDEFCGVGLCSLGSLNSKISMDSNALGARSPTLTAPFLTFSC